ncbi:CHAD domain-containing protein [Luteitalea sp.]|jgi:CHAD domain-containing protein|uniref:CHAD domain-containing protein n=1 Tax=Luteitalea sp. TaxID=2004800 RepID=UPI0037CCAB9C
MASMRPSAAPSLASLIARRHQALRDHVRSARRGDVEGVHQARVASRRLREAVPVLGRGLDDVRLKPLRRRLRDLTRALGPVRELDVAGEMVEGYAWQGRDAVRLRRAWLRDLAHRRREPVVELRTALARTHLAALESALDAFEAARAASADLAWRTALARRLADRAQDLRDRIVRTGDRYHPEPLHEVRIAAKKLRYALEITAESGLVGLVRPLASLKAAQEALGRLHDLDVLTTLLRELPEAAPGEDLQHEAARVAGALEAESAALHARYLRAAAGLVRIADDTLDRIVPRVRGQVPRALGRTDGR